MNCDANSRHVQIFKMAYLENRLTIFTQILTGILFSCVLSVLVKWEKSEGGGSGPGWFGMECPMSIIKYFYLRGHWRPLEVSKGQKEVKMENIVWRLLPHWRSKEVNIRKYTQGCIFVNTYPYVTHEYYTHEDYRLFLP